MWDEAWLRVGTRLRCGLMAYLRRRSGHVLAHMHVGQGVHDILVPTEYFEQRRRFLPIG